MSPSANPIGREKRRNLYEIFDEATPAATEFRRLHSRIRYRSRGAAMSPLVVTSAKHAEGKTTTASYLAATIARVHHAKTLLVDMDLHRPKVHEMFELPRDEAPGVAEVLSGTAKAVDAIVPSRIENLSLLLAGRAVRSPSSLFDPLRVRALLSDVRSLFDSVIIDTAPLIPVSDTMVVSVEAAGVLYVLMAGETPREVALRAKSLLDDVNAKILGVIVNNAEEVLPYYYDYKYYGYKS